MSVQADRILGCLKGVATGDAIGKQTEGLSHESVRRWYPQGVRGFEGTPGAVIPRYIGNARHEWRIGETTDDTERTLAVARAIIADRAVFHVSIGREMLTCTKSVHPGVRSLWEFHQLADPARVATAHDGCGAAVRAAPVGIFYSSNRLADIASGAREASISTHGGRLAIAAAAATAAAVSAAIDGGSGDRVLECAVAAADWVERRWFANSPPVFGEIIRRVRDTLTGLATVRPGELATWCFPDKPATIVPLALAMGAVFQSADEAILLAANIGGDSDSVASIAGAILGARNPETVNRAWFEVVEDVNGHDIEQVAAVLTRLRH